MSRYLLLISIWLLPATALCRPVKDTIKLYFDIGISDLKPSEQQKIDSLIYYDKLRPGKKLGIIGYADYLGSDTSNIGLSETRANKVKSYLLSMGINDTDIQTVIGKGEVQRDVQNSTAGYMEDRRVDIIPGGIPGPPKPTVKKTVAKAIDISKVKKNETIRLDNIYFLPGSHQRTDASVPALVALLATMQQNPTLKIGIEGHICCLLGNTTDGYDEDEQDFHLSLNRAKAIYDYLAQRGIDKSRMSYRGFGKTRPLVNPEKTPEDENRNRRVEIRIVDK